ncbi:MAG: hypothetical protein OXU48_04435 [candidate division Zixibacteria bacterium]|nr:hypothetical protein [candidate division Zixibacteria bacterium]
MKVANLKHPTRLRSCGETFNVRGESAGFSLSDYWKWSGSDLLSNAQRGVIAEFLVAKVLGVNHSPRLEWGWYDLETTDKKKIEVKSAAYYQSWPQDKPSEIRFDIAPRKWFWDPVTNRSESSETPERRSDAYVFCLLGDPADRNPDPLILDQWSFYVIRTCSINRLLELQKTIGLDPLRKLVREETGRCEVKYLGLAGVISEQLTIT